MRKHILLRLSAIFLIGLPVIAFALDLGKVQLHSYLNQPLKASIELRSVGKISLKDIKVQLAAAKNDKQRAAQLPLTKADVKFQIKKNKEGAPLVNIQTEKPLTQLNTLLRLQLSWPKHKKIREYAILLDNAQQEESAREFYGPVKPNEQLWGIAKTLRPTKKLTMAQTMIAFRNQNPSAFIHHNANGLMRGVVLQIPRKKEILEITPIQATQALREDNIQWKNGIFSANHQQVVSQPSEPPQTEIAQPEPIQTLPIDSQPNTIQKPIDKPTPSNQQVTQKTETVQPLVLQTKAFNDLKSPDVDSAQDVKIQIQLLNQQLDLERTNSQKLSVTLGDLQQANRDLQKKIIAKDATINALTIKLTYYQNKENNLPRNSPSTTIDRVIATQHSMNNALLNQTNRMQWMMGSVIAILVILLIVFVYLMIHERKSDR